MLCCCQSGLVLCSGFILMECLFSSYCCNEALGLSVFVIYSAAQRDSMFPAARRREREEKTAGQTFSSRLIECAQFTCVWEMFAFFSSLCLCVRAKQTVTSDLINLSDQFLFLRVNIYLNMCRCVHVLVMTHTLAHTDAHRRTHTEQRIQLRSAAHPGLSNILSAQPKNHNWTLWEALIQSTVTMLSETKSTACSQHINSQLTLSLYLSISISLSSGFRCTNFPSSVFTAMPVLPPTLPQLF